MFQKTNLGNFNSSNLKATQMNCIYIFNIYYKLNNGLAWQGELYQTVTVQTRGVNRKCLIFPCNHKSIKCGMLNQLSEVRAACRELTVKWRLMPDYTKYIELSM